MQTEQAPHEHYDTFNQPQVGVAFEHDNDLHVSNLEQLAAEAKDAAIGQPLEETVQNRLEYRPLSPQEVVQMIGRKVVLDLRKGYNDTHIVLNEEINLSASYMDDVDDVVTPEVGQVFQFPDRSNAQQAESRKAA